MLPALVHSHQDYSVQQHFEPGLIESESVRISAAVISGSVETVEIQHFMFYGNALTGMEKRHVFVQIISCRAGDQFSTAKFTLCEPSLCLALSLKYYCCKVFRLAFLLG